jgi:hypothetical protein
VALHISIQYSIRAGPVVIVPPRRGNEAWQPLKPQPRLTVTDFFLYFFSTAPPGRGCTSFLGVMPRPCNTALRCFGIYNPLSPRQLRGRGDDASSLRHPFRSLFGLKKNWLDFRSTGTRRRSDPSDVRSSGFSTDHSHHGVV